MGSVVRIAKFRQGYRSPWHGSPWIREWSGSDAIGFITTLGELLRIG